jgi:hypothetical protein
MMNASADQVSCEIGKVVKKKSVVSYDLKDWKSSEVETLSIHKAEGVAVGGLSTVI